LRPTDFFWRIQLFPCNFSNNASICRVRTTDEFGGEPLLIDYFFKLGIFVLPRQGSAKLKNPDHRIDAV
ncbi:MAG: hypothetical protein KJO26_08200, partial [Deltaproteobacteria bacterium]|nr:hypothetical protein [Deltaproteobacteria bacterium]